MSGRSGASGSDLHDGLGQQITGIIFHAHLLHKHLAGTGCSEEAVAAASDRRRCSTRQSAGASDRPAACSPSIPPPIGLMTGLGHFVTTTTELYHIRLLASIARNQC